MQISSDEGAFLTMLTRLVDARYAVEVGTFTGYSSICIARGLAAGGHLLCCDVSDEWTTIARRYWQRAGVADRIELAIGPAADTLRALPDRTADRPSVHRRRQDGLPAYYEEILAPPASRRRHCARQRAAGRPRRRPGLSEEHHQAMRRLNDLIAPTTGSKPSC